MPTGRTFDAEQYHALMYPPFTVAAPQAPPSALDGLLAKIRDAFANSDPLAGEREAVATLLGSRPPSAGAGSSGSPLDVPHDNDGSPYTPRLGPPRARGPALDVPHDNEGNPYTPQLTPRFPYSTPGIAGNVGVPGGGSGAGGAGGGAAGGGAGSAGRAMADVDPKLRSEILGLLSQGDREKAKAALAETLFGNNAAQAARLGQLADFHTLGHAFAAGGAVTGNPMFARLNQQYQRTGAQMADHRKEPERRRRAKLAELSAILGQDLNYAQDMERFQGNRVEIDGEVVPSRFATQALQRHYDQKLNPRKADPLEQALQLAKVDAQTALAEQRRASGSLSKARQDKLEKELAVSSGLEGAALRDYSILVRSFLPNREDGTPPTPEERAYAERQAQAVISSHLQQGQSTGDPLLDAILQNDSSLTGDPFLEPDA